MRSFLATAFLVALINHTVLPWNCATIRAFAQGKTSAQLEQFARQYGLTAKQRAAALACLRHGGWT